MDLAGITYLAKSGCLCFAENEVDVLSRTLVNVFSCTITFLSAALCGVSRWVSTMHWHTHEGFISLDCCILSIHYTRNLLPLYRSIFTSVRLVTMIGRVYA